MKSRLMLTAVAILLGIFVLSSFLVKANPAAASPAESTSISSIAYLPLVMNNSPLQITVYLPLVMNNSSLQTVFGAAMNQITLGQGLGQMVAAKMSWTRLPGVLWSNVEPNEGTYDWSILSGLETELKNASSKGIQVVMLVSSTPEWARKIAGTGPTCGPIAADKLPAFGDFMHALVARYSVAPYNIKYWEMWNEEDVDPSLVPSDSPYGCWGDQNDAYYGGGYYAEMLKVVYPQIKAADPQAQVLIGGLLLDCDPRGGCAMVGHSNAPAMFMEGILRNDGAAYFDGVSFHAYDYYLNKLGEYYNPNWASAWNTTGPVGITKAQFIQSLLNQYGVSGKFLMTTESALICGKTGTEAPCQTDDFSNTKAYYVTQAYAAAITQGLRANIWYSVLGWRGSGLLNRDLSPLPAYTAFKFSRSELSDANWARDVTEYSGVKVYEFQRGDHRIWVLWSLDGDTHLINLPGVPLAAWDALGNSVFPAASMDIDLNPVYLEWNQ